MSEEMVGKGILPPYALIISHIQGWSGGTSVALNIQNMDLGSSNYNKL